MTLTQVEHKRRHAPRWLWSVSITTASERIEFWHASPVVAHAAAARAHLIAAREHAAAERRARSRP